MAGRRQLLWPVGAPYVGVFRSLLATCRSQEIDPYTYLVDVLQQVESLLAKQVGFLTPRRWKEHFAADPLRSAVDRVGKDAGYCPVPLPPPY